MEIKSLKSLVLFIISGILLTPIICSCENSKEEGKALLALVSNGTILDDNPIYFWGDYYEGDKINFSDYDYLPKFKNISNLQIDTILIYAEIFPLQDTLDISSYYIIDKVSKNDEGLYNVLVHYGKFHVYPYEEIPFPLICYKNTDRKTCPLCIRYDYAIVYSKKNILKNRCGLFCMVYPTDNESRKKESYWHQKSFMYHTRTFMNNKNNDKYTLIFRDTIAQNVDKSLLLKDKEIKFDKLSDLE